MLPPIIQILQTFSAGGLQMSKKGMAVDMIEVTRLNGTKLTINADLIERVEELPDTVIKLTTGSKIIVKESRQEIKNLVTLYKKEIFCRDL